MFYQPSFESSAIGGYNKDVYSQLEFLKEEVHDGTALKMQSIYPEGFIFLNALYGLSWCNLVQNLEQSHPIRQEAIEEISWAFKEMNTPKGKEVFEENLPLAYGAFYRGWNNFLLGNKLKVLSTNERDSSDIRLFRHNCAEIVEAVNKSKSPFLESYSNNTWPADMLIGIASVNIYNEIFEQKYDGFIDNWIAEVKLKLDSATCLIPHSVNSISGEAIEGARGSSQSLMLNFLKEIDGVFAKEQFEIYKELFLTKRVGLSAIREYPIGSKLETGDIDSGPVILEIGGAASIVGQRTMGKYKDWDTYICLRNSIEAFGAAYQSKGKKKFLFGQLPMADAFIAWSNSLETQPNQVNSSIWWRTNFQLQSFLLLLICVGLIWKIK